MPESFILERVLARPKPVLRDLAASSQTSRSHHLSSSCSSEVTHEARPTLGERALHKAVLETLCESHPSLNQPLITETGTSQFLPAPGAGVRSPNHKATIIAGKSRG